VNREEIYSALFDLVSGAYKFTTKSRRLRHWSDVTPAMQPALYQAQGNESIELPGRGIPAKVTLRAKLYIYARSGGTPDSVPATIINTLLDAVDAALATTDASEEQTLGGLVSHCRVVGTIETDEGVLGDQGLAIVPIEIVVNI